MLGIFLLLPHLLLTTALGLKHFAIPFYKRRREGRERSIYLCKEAKSVAELQFKPATLWLYTENNLCFRRDVDEVSCSTVSGNKRRRHVRSSQPPGCEARAGKERPSLGVLFTLARPPPRGAMAGTAFPVSVTCGACVWPLEPVVQAGPTNGSPFCLGGFFLEYHSARRS